MRYKVYAIILILFLFVTNMFSVFTIVPMDHSINLDCPIASMINGACPPSNSPIAVVSHHISGIMSLSQAVFIGGFNFSSIFLLAIFAFVFSGLIKASPEKKILSYTFVYRLRMEILEFFYSYKQKILFWSSIHNKRYFPGTLIRA